jgi:hypothetical protein
MPSVKDGTPFQAARTIIEEEPGIVKGDYLYDLWFECVVQNV